MANDVEVVMFFGPPFAGKTMYYRHNLKTSHERVSAVDLFAENPDLGLRQVILRIVALLKQGVNVVIDDENWSRATRLSYIKSILSKVPNCKFRCVTFNPDSPVTLRWLQEWHLAKSALCRDEPCPDGLARRDARIQRWFEEDTSMEKRPERPTPQEGYSLQDVPVKLTTEEDYKFEVPALFIQWEGIILQPDDDGGVCICRDGTGDMLQAWTSVNPWGRIVIIAADPHCADPKMREQAILNLKQAVGKLSRCLSVPVYFCCLLDTRSAWPFAKPPQPGLLAFLQRCHRIHLWHRGTVYLYHSQDHAGTARAAGVKHRAATSALQNPNWVDSARDSSCRDDIDPTLKDVTLIGVPDSGHGRSVTPTVPLYSEAVDALTDGGCYVQEWTCGRAMGICYKDKDTLDRYQKLYADTATRVSEPGSRMTARVPERSTTAETRKDAHSGVHNQHTSTRTTTKSENPQTTRGLPAWMMPLKTRKTADRHIDSESLQDSSQEVPLRKKKTNEPPLPSTVYCLSTVELYETALLLLQQNKEAVDLQDVNRDNSSLPQEVAESLSATKTTSPGQVEDLQTASSPEEMMEEVIEGEPNFLDEIFPVQSTEMKPPPRKTNAAQKIQRSPASLSVRPECLAAETVTCVQETAGYTASLGTKESTTSGIGKSSAEQQHKGAKPIKGPDFSFLDDIF